MGMKFRFILFIQIMGIQKITWHDIKFIIDLTAVATKIRPYICRVNNLKIIHLKKWLVVLKRTD